MSHICAINTKEVQSPLSLLRFSSTLRRMAAICYRLADFISLSAVLLRGGISFCRPSCRAIDRRARLGAVQDDAGSARCLASCSGAGPLQPSSNQFTIAPPARRPILGPFARPAPRGRNDGDIVRAGAPFAPNGARNDSLYVTNLST